MKSSARQPKAEPKAEPKTEEPKQSRPAPAGPTRSGRHYRRIIDAVQADLAAAEPLTEAQLGRIIPILRGAA